MTLNVVRFTLNWRFWSFYVRLAKRMNRSERKQMPTWEAAVPRASSHHRIIAGSFCSGQPKTLSLTARPASYPKTDDSLGRTSIRDRINKSVDWAIVASVTFTFCTFSSSPLRMYQHDAFNCHFSAAIHATCTCRARCFHHHDSRPNVVTFGQIEKDHFLIVSIESALSFGLFHSFERDISSTNRIPTKKAWIQLWKGMTNKDEDGQTTSDTFDRELICPTLFRAVECKHATFARQTITRDSFFVRPTRSFVVALLPAQEHVRIYEREQDFTCESRRTLFDTSVEFKC
jgi:hypothetical protein